MFILDNQKLVFPPVFLANSDGLLAAGGDLSVKRLKLAYENGIFPWFDNPKVILWWAPDPRMVLFPDEIKISKSMRNLIRKDIYKITENKAFDQVITYCSQVPRKDQEGTWLHDQMIEAYKNLHQAGLAFSIEVWNQQGELVGGLYAVQTHPDIISGESMFHLEPNTSKLAYIHLAQKAQKEGVKIIDCQLYTDHLASLGAREIPRADFMKYFDK